MNPIIVILLIAVIAQIINYILNKIILDRFHISKMQDDRERMRHYLKLNKESYTQDELIRKNRLISGLTTKITIQQSKVLVIFLPILLIILSSLRFHYGDLVFWQWMGFKINYLVLFILFSLLISSITHSLKKMVKKQ